MPTDVQSLAKVLDEAISSGDIETAINNYGGSLSDTEKSAVRALSPDQMRDTLRNLVTADSNLHRILFVDTNVNNR